MTSFYQMPEWMKESELYKILLENENEKKDCIIGKELMLEPKFSSGLRDVLKMIDTCAYIGLDKLPKETYSYALLNKSLLAEMDEFESDQGELVSYSAFIKTPEYQAIRMCALEEEDVMSEIIETALDMHYENLLTEAIKMNNMSLIRWIVEDIGICENADIEMAVKSGHIHIVQYLLAKIPDVMVEHFKWTNGNSMTAAQNGDLEMLKYLEKKGCKIGQPALIEALRMTIINKNMDCLNHIDCVDYIRKILDIE
jgi:hypothetical protein